MLTPRQIKKYLPKGFRIYSGQWRYDFHTGRQGNGIVYKNMATYDPNTHVFVINYIDFAPEQIDQALTKKYICSALRQVLPLTNKPLCLALGGKVVPKFGTSYTIEYYACLSECPSFETLQELEKILKSPVLIEEP